MTGRAIRLAQMPPMIETGIKALESGKFLQAARLCVRMTDRAHRALGLLEFDGVTAGAWQVPVAAWKTHAGRTLFLRVADKTGQSIVGRV